ncbi:MAG: GDP-mannose 4,6-dehydratase [Kiritimatiellae bacterium]|nr:GDP-mannose 4,6-dehydratase [Kiritimatiellia bacterium]
MKKVLITGAGGFIGSHLVERCAALGHEVRAFVRYNSQGRWGWLDRRPRGAGVEVISGDIRDLDSVRRAVQGVDTVFHLAALIGIPYSYVSPLAYIRTNIEGTYNVLQAARDLGGVEVLVTSTSETYGTAQYVPIDERHPAVGQSPYAATKIAADQLALSFHRSFGLPVKIVRPFNTFGPRQSARAFIPAVIIQLLGGAETLRLGNLAPTRDLTYVKDTVEGFLAIARAPDLAGEATNVGMDTEISMGDLARRISRLVAGREVEIVAEEARVRPEASEVERLRCANAKLRERTGWAPAYDLDRGLEETIAWLRDHVADYKAELYHV